MKKTRAVAVRVLTKVGEDVAVCRGCRLIALAWFNGDSAPFLSVNRRPDVLGKDLVKVISRRDRLRPSLCSLSHLQWHGMSEPCRCQATLPVSQSNLLICTIFRGVAVSMHNGLKSRALSKERRQLINTLSVLDSVWTRERWCNSIVYISPCRLQMRPTCFGRDST